MHRAAAGPARRGWRGSTAFRRCGRTTSPTARRRRIRRGRGRVASSGSRGTTNVFRAASSRRTRSSRARCSGFSIAAQSSVARRTVSSDSGSGTSSRWLRVGFGEFLAPAVAHRFRELALEVAEERKRLARAPFVAHEQQRRRRREQRHGQRGLERRGWRQRRQPLAERAVADLIVVLQEIDERGGGQRRARLAARLALAMRRRLALIGKSFGKGSGDVLRRLRDSRRSSRASRRSAARARRGDSRRSIARDICRAADR